MKVTRRPTRHDLLKVVTELQNLIGHASALHADDRNRHGFEQAQNTLQEAFDLCVSARSFDPPTDV